MTQLYRKKNRGAEARGFAFGKYPLGKAERAIKRQKKSGRKSRRSY